MNIQEREQSINEWLLGLETKQLWKDIYKLETQLNWSTV